MIGLTGFMLREMMELTFDIEVDEFDIRFWIVIGLFTDYIEAKEPLSGINKKAPDLTNSAF